MSGGLLTQVSDLCRLRKLEESTRSKMILPSFLNQRYPQFLFFVLYRASIGCLQFSSFWSLRRCDNHGREDLRINEPSINESVCKSIIMNRR